MAAGCGATHVWGMCVRAWLGGGDGMCGVDGIIYVGAGWGDWVRVCLFLWGWVGGIELNGRTEGWGIRYMCACEYEGLCECV